MRRPVGVKGIRFGIGWSRCFFPAALDLAIQNQIDRFSLAIDAIDRVPKLQRIGAHAKEEFRNLQIECRNYAYVHGVDKPELDQWTWPT
jgi:xylulose-5-phosphate/fructose-6-phosphate phosphoketolase